MTKERPSALSFLSSAGSVQKGGWNSSLSTFFFFLSIPIFIPSLTSGILSCLCHVRLPSSPATKIIAVVIFTSISSIGLKGGSVLNFSNYGGPRQSFRRGQADGGGRRPHRTPTQQYRQGYIGAWMDHAAVNRAPSYTWRPGHRAYPLNRGAGYRFGMTY
jgi:hypothetical protein